MSTFPKYVKDYWAVQIGNTPRDGKVPKHIETIRTAWPKVPAGWLILDHKKLVPYQENLEGDYDEKPLTRSITADEAEEVGEAQILEAFETVSFNQMATSTMCNANA